MKEHEPRLQSAESSDKDSTDKWEAQLRKGCLELAILSALWDEDCYGLEILRQVESDSALIVSEGTVYPLLSRLKAMGMLSSEWVESESAHPRKYYALTAKGRLRAREMAGMWLRFSSSMSKLLAPLAKELKEKK